ncbi:RWD-domain-containing protein [Aulographum hederae CBS 113979]|uniref:RWD-domain-containing protein n=1 Tax=Aulographum hederae CBS 113979 TaxID=1176131 RepID=A0A6G1H8Y4_9PEZI|nr:RWD-domain-containing protein [Aulographum hederae CBS 113979]
MGKEEQVEEREVLDSIFPDEITDISETEYRISVALDIVNPNADEDEDEPPTLLLQVRYPEAYPDVAPDLEILAPPNAPKYPHLDLQEDKPHLLSSLAPTIEENIGMAMVFTLVSTLKESAEALVAERQDAIQAEKEVEAAKAEEEENRKFHGTAVTRESFLEWRERFQKDMEEEKRRKEEEAALEDKKKRVAKEEVRLTGRQLWERGLARGDDEEEAGEESVDIEKLKIQA